jgi:hypothetical protein
MHRDLIGAHSYELEILEFFGPVAAHAQFLTGPIAMNDVILDLSGIEKIPSFARSMACL